jgi:hypothetical protein
MASSLTPRVEG